MNGKQNPTNGNLRSLKTMTNTSMTQLHKKITNKLIQ